MRYFIHPFLLAEVLCDATIHDCGAVPDLPPDCATFLNRNDISNAGPRVERENTVGA